MSWRDLLVTRCLQSTSKLFPWLEWLSLIVKRDLESIRALDKRAYGTFEFDLSSAQFELCVQIRMRDSFFKL
jgi:hypothetical protein